MRISDWSSDVCSSDLHQHEEAGGVEEGEDEEEHGVHRIARAHHHNPRGHGDGGEEIEGQGLNDHAAGLLSVSRPLRPWPAAAPVLSISCTGNSPNISCDAPSRSLLSAVGRIELQVRSEEHTSELQSLMSNTYAVICLKKK